MNPVPALLRSTILLIYSSHPISYHWWLWKERIVLYPAQLSLQQALTNKRSFVFRKKQPCFRADRTIHNVTQQPKHFHTSLHSGNLLMATALVSPGTGSSVAELAWDSWTALWVKALDKGDGCCPHSYQCGKERLISPGKAKAYARQPWTSCCNAQMWKWSLPLHPFPNCRYLSIFSGFAETWPGCAWRHSAFKKVHLLQQQKRLGFFPLIPSHRKYHCP